MKITVLYGGSSAEREISLRSGSAVAKALEERGHEVTLFDTEDVLPEPTDCDLYFIALHGTGGEDGYIQSYLDDLNVPYTGSGAVASEIAFSKWYTKRLLVQNHVRTPLGKIVHVSDSFDLTREKLKSLGFPCIIKPERQGSSIGISMATDADELEQALLDSFQFDPYLVVEQFIHGRELTLPVLNDIILPVVEIRTTNEYFDFSAKYEDATTEFICPTVLPKNVSQQISIIGNQVCHSMGIRGAARIDFILDSNEDLYVLEVNTIPGMTESSTLPRAAAVHGWNFAELCEQICLAALMKKNLSSPGDLLSLRSTLERFRRNEINDLLS